MSRLALCSGQGGQHPAMFARLLAHPAARPVLSEASVRLDLDIASEHDLAATDIYANRTAQILVTAHCLATALALGPDSIDLCIGYSVGEIAACACAGAFDFKTAFELIERRVEIMDAASAGTPQGMLAVVGIRLDRLREICTSDDVHIAIVNGPYHAVLGGLTEALDRIEAGLPALGARNVRRLPVRIASHTDLLAAAGPAFAEVISGIDWKRPRISVLSGLDGRPIQSHDDATQALSEQLCKTIDFDRCLRSALEHGATVGLELGPGRALVRMAQDTIGDVPTRAFEDFRSPEGAASWMSART